MEFRELSRSKTFMNGDFAQDAIDLLTSLIQKSQKNYLAYFMLGSVLHWSMKDEVKAIQALEKSVSLKPQFLRAWACLGVALQIIS